jgi:hypothetical protein
LQRATFLLFAGKSKRGCSEFAVEYPDYNKFDEKGEPVMPYPEEWRKYDQEFDKNWRQGQSYLESLSCSHEGLTLFDALVMRNWTAYAQKIGDESISA